MSRFSGSGWIVSEQEKGQWEGVILHPTPALNDEQNGLNRSDRSQADFLECCRDEKTVRALSTSMTLNLERLSLTETVHTSWLGERLHLRLMALLLIAYCRYDRIAHPTKTWINAQNEPFVFL